MDTNIDVKDLQRRWQEVAKTCAYEYSAAPPKDKAKWEDSRKAAQAVADALTPVVKLEKKACNLWQVARHIETAPATAAKSGLRLVP